MLKKELLELIENVEDVQEVDEILKNSELANKFGSLDIFKEKVKADKDFKSFIDSVNDKHAEKYLNTWKTNNLEKLLDEEVKKRFPEADPKDNELAKLKAEIDKMQKESLRKDITNKAIKLATDKKLPVDLIDFLIGDDEEITTKNIDKLESVFGTHVESLVQERLKTNSYTPPSGGSATTGTYEDLLKNADNMSAQQVAEMFSKIGK